MRHAVLALALIVHAPRLLLRRRRHQVQLLLLRQVRRGHSRLLLLDGLVVKDALPHHQPQRAVPHGVALHAPAAEAAHHHLALARVVHAAPAERAVAPLALVLQLVLRVVQPPEALRLAARHLALIVRALPTALRTGRALGAGRRGGGRVQEVRGGERDGAAAAEGVGGVNDQIAVGVHLHGHCHVHAVGVRLLVVQRQLQHRHVLLRQHGIAAQEEKSDGAAGG